MHQQRAFDIFSGGPGDPFLVEPRRPIVQWMPPKPSLLRRLLSWLLPLRSAP